MRVEYKMLRRATNLLIVASVVLCLPYGSYLYKCEMNDWLLNSIGYNDPNDHSVAYVQRVLQLGANPNITNEYGVTPLMIAIACGHPRIVKVLLQYGADPNWPTETGNSMLWARVKANSDPAVKPTVPEIIVMLKAAGAREWKHQLPPIY